MKYYHLSSYQSLILDEKFYQKIYKKKYDRDMKPFGLYFAKDDEWLNFLHEEDDPLLEDKEYLHRIIFSKDTNFYKISNFKELSSFDFKYRKNGETHIDWLKVKEDYDGIIMENYYQLKLSLDHSPSSNYPIWFTSFDVNGGCIWNYKKARSFLIDKNIFNKYFKDRHSLKELLCDIREKLKTENNCKERIFLKKELNRIKEILACF